MDHTDHDVPSGLSWARKGEGGYIAIFVVVLQKKCNEFCTFKCALTYTLMILHPGLATIFKRVS